MTIFNSVSKIFGLNDQMWMRHSNKWSVWTRAILLPFFAIVFWYRVEIGQYYLVLIAVLLFWTWINPRFFKKPKSTKHWASKAVFGERVWLNRKDLPIPEHHNRAIIVLNIITGSGLPFLIYGLYEIYIWPVLIGLVLSILGKLWFLDRMVWLYEDMKGKSKIYSSWDY